MRYLRSIKSGCLAIKGTFIRAKHAKITQDPPLALRKNKQNLVKKVKNQKIKIPLPVTFLYFLLVQLVSGRCLLQFEKFGPVQVKKG